MATLFVKYHSTRNALSLERIFPKLVDRQRLFSWFGDFYKIH